ncbi:kinase-like domain-containing protein [Dendryphion nanum]|uniref:Kinase-like domain-containing protein n=1 Tax=Dendryphion nanum TaxID=256645 RepID=A0A9P9E9B1_9PLEO|nr:kinase-like domain-containing protein [Dendryphion nanum]
MKPSERKRERDRIISEIDNLRALRHPHIVSILGCYQEPHKYRYSILMYPVGDEDLHKCFHEVSSEIAEGLPAPRTWVMRNWFHCLLSALAYIHSCNMRHDDIKPRNIIHRGGHVFFTDFGSSKKIVDSNHTTTESLASATRLYAAPEALRDLQTNEVSSHGRKSDVYSLGLVFAEMDTLIAGATLPQLHAFLERESGGKFQQNPKPGEIPEYHRVAYLLGSWFFEIGVPKVYIDLIAPMLREVRDERVSAHAHSCTLSSLLQPSSCHPDCEWWRKGPI